jgi:hypothetical protein
MQLEVTGDWLLKFEDLTAQLSADQIDFAAARALNRASRSALAAIDNLVASDLKLKVGDVRDAVRIREATPGRLQATLEPRRKKLPLMKFGASGPLPSRGRGKVTANTGQGRKTYEGAFIARMRSGHEGVFIRVGYTGAGAATASASSRKSKGAWSMNLPIAELRGPSVAQAFRKYHKEGMAAGEESLRKNLLSELRFQVRQSS